MARRAFCEEFLKKFGVDVTYYRPSIGAGIEALVKPNTAIYMESPGSLTFEMTDVPAITAVARARGIKTVFDNTWSSPVNFRPLEHGVDVSINAATKYISGHSDLMLGVAVCTRKRSFRSRRRPRAAATAAGRTTSTWPCAACTLPLRMKQHHAAALAVAQWLQARPEVARVMYPALPDDPGHAIWKRDYDGASGLFGVVLNACTDRQFAAMLDHMDLFKLGYSWGGYESLVVPTYPSDLRSEVTWKRPAPACACMSGWKRWTT
jgi:cystathionine beta-lyase